MNSDWQTWAAAGVVIVTALIFLSRVLKKKHGSGCSTCGNAGPPVKRR